VAVLVERLVALALTDRTPFLTLQLPEHLQAVLLPQVVAVAVQMLLLLRDRLVVLGVVAVH
jgi:hypothetical protein